MIATVLAAVMTALTAFTAEELKVFRLFRNTRGMLASDWARDNLRLQTGEHAEPGRYDPDATPYMKAPMDAVTRPGVKTVIGLKGARVGWSLGMRGVGGFLVDCDPGPQMWVQPDRESLTEFFRDELVPVFTDTPALADYLTGRDADITQRRIRLTNCRIIGAWATSPGQFRRRSIRYLFGEEASGYPNVGREGDVLALALKRLATFGDRARAFIGSSPTVKASHLWKQWERCALKYEWWVPCPDCGHHQVLRWENIK